MNLPTGFDQRFDSLRLVRELGSYSAAAQELNLSPSAIAQQIHALERELDALLFIRDGNRLLPTEVCEIAADYAAQAASLRRRMELETGDGVEIFVEKDRVILKKYEPACLFCGDAEDVVTYKDKKICKKCLRELQEAQIDE